MTDVTDATFATAVIERSDAVPVVVDLWAPWCGPCRTLGPMLEDAVAATGGKVELAKINIDENPGIASGFGVQSIPLVYAFYQRKVVDQFLGALPKREVEAFVAGLVSEETELDKLLAENTEQSLQAALDIDPGNTQAVLQLAELLVDAGRNEEALTLLARVPETAETRPIAARARSGGSRSVTDIEIELQGLLSSVKSDESARQRYVDLLELLDSSDPRTIAHRKALSQALF